MISGLAVESTCCLPVEYISGSIQIICRLAYLLQKPFHLIVGTPFLVVFTPELMVLKMFLFVKLLSEVDSIALPGNPRTNLHPETRRDTVASNAANNSTTTDGSPSVYYS